MDFEIITLNSSNFIKSVEEKLGKKILKIESGNFADSEFYINPPNVLLKNKQVFILQQFSFTNKSINEQLLEFLFLADLVKKLGAKKINAVLPYLPYSRQAKNFSTSLIGPISLLGKICRAACIDNVDSFELHEGLIKKLFVIPLREISLINFGADFFYKNKDILFDDENVCFVSPDKGRSKFIEKIARIAKKPFAYVCKERVEKDQAVAKKLIGNVKNKNVIIIDDIIDTANTAIGACDIVINNGAKEVIGFFAHPVFSRDAVNKIEKSRFSKVFITDTVLVEDKLKKSKKIIQTTLVDIFVKFFKEHYL